LSCDDKCSEQAAGGGGTLCHLLANKVRHLQKRKSFDKSSSVSTYTKKISTITRIDGNKIYLDDLTKPFREYELILAVGEPMSQDYQDKLDIDARDNVFNRRMRKEGLN